MHFSIPDTEDIKEDTSTVYKVYNIHINGVLHCSVRYSQLHDLNEKLKKEVGQQSLPPFPPKRLFTLNEDEIESRKLLLEKYVQEISQEVDSPCAPIFNAFLRKAQQETRQEEKLQVSMDIWLLNGSKVSLDIFNIDKTHDILQTALSRMNLPNDMMHYFGLYLVFSNSDAKFSVIRKLQEFECPYLSLKSLHERRSHKIVIRKSYWDQANEPGLMENRIALNLLYVQAESDISLGWTKTTPDILERLEKLSKRGSKYEFVELCQTLPGYGFLQFNPCLSNYPHKNCKVTVSVGNFQILFKSMEEHGLVETFSVTRIKCWKISSQLEPTGNRPSPDHPVLQLSFEYLVSKGNLQWIYLLSNQAIMMSMSIKSMVNELIRRKKGEKIKKPSDQSQTKHSFKPRDKNTQGFFDPSEIQDVSGDGGSVYKAKDSVVKFTNKIASLSGLKKVENDSLMLNTNQSPTTQAGIGDDDL